MAGFSESKKKLNTQRSSSRTLHGYVLGDALIALGVAIRKLGFPVEEVEREEASGGMMPGMIVRIPFRHHTTADGIDVPYGNYKLSGFGVVAPMIGGDDGDSPIPELTLSV